jgi:hypothetical protein
MLNEKLKALNTSLKNWGKNKKTVSDLYIGFPVVIENNVLIRLNPPYVLGFVSEDKKLFHLFNMSNSFEILEREENGRVKSGYVEKKHYINNPRKVLELLDIEDNKCPIEEAYLNYIVEELGKRNIIINDLNQGYVFERVK